MQILGGVIEKEFIRLNGVSTEIYVEKIGWQLGWVDFWPVNIGIEECI